MSYTIHQFHHSLSPGDAVTGQMRFIRDALREIGIQGEIFGSQIKDIPPDQARPFDGARIEKGDLLLLHHSQGNPALSEVLSLGIPKALVYHNITPPEFFRHDPYLSGLCHLGRQQLDEIRKWVTATFTVSRFNAKELIDAGFSQVSRLPLLDLAKWPSHPPAERAQPARFLSVGKLLPHKNQALALKVMYYWKHFLRRPGQLVLVGGEDPVYGCYLKLLVKALAIEDRVVMTGKVSDEVLRQQYATATAYLSTSLHEGFGVPLVEAMASDLPVFALPLTGVRETLGRAGFHWTTQAPHAMAEALGTTLDDKSALERILIAQRERLASLRTEQTKGAVQQTLGALVGALARQDVVAVQESHAHWLQ